ncbi:unnamed protein product [Polarella glacialis]|uniref:Uncharacterized protein n=1 Tax=Polarella glacialis TaxID=89957 RepID=A0A813IRS8_POLGL|nr:unnamed protein product [Polarella glacialis]
MTCQASVACEEAPEAGQGHELPVQLEEVGLKSRSGDLEHGGGLGIVMILAQLTYFRTLSSVNLFLALGAVIYLAINIVCTVLNSYDHDCDLKDQSCHAVTTPYVFHMLEFWATFFFNVLDVIALMYSPKQLQMIFWSPLLLKIITALMVSINLHKFEIPSHELGYVNELTVALCDLIILTSLFRGLGSGAGVLVKRQKSSLVWTIMLICFAACVAVAQLGIYKGMGWVGNGSTGEVMAHYCEFAFAIISAGITFWFTMDNKIIADTQIRSLVLTGRCNPDFCGI